MSFRWASTARHPSSSSPSASDLPIPLHVFGKSSLERQHCFVVKVPPLFVQVSSTSRVGELEGFKDGAGVDTHLSPSKHWPSGQLQYATLWLRSGAQVQLSGALQVSGKSSAHKQQDAPEVKFPPLLVQVSS